MKKFLHFVLFLSIPFWAAGQTTEVISHWETVTLEMAQSFNNGYFGDSLFAPVANPNPSGINTTDSVQLWKKATDAAAWGGYNYLLPEAIDLTGEIGMICLDVYGENPFRMRVKLEESNDGGPDLSFDLEYTAAGEWEQLCYDLFGADSGGGIGAAQGFTYNKLVLFPGREGVPAVETAYYVDNIKKTTGTKANTVTKIMAAYEPYGLKMGGSFGNGYFADSLFAAVPNPNPSGINTSGNVQIWKKATDAVTWGGYYFDLPEPLELTGQTGQVCIDVYGDKEFLMQFKIEDHVGDGPDVSFDMDYTTPGEWQQLCYDLMGFDNQGNFGTAAGFTYTRIALFPDRGVVPAEETSYYLDNIVKTTGSGLDEDYALISDYEPMGTAIQMALSFGNGHFGDSIFPVVANPSMDAVNSSMMVQQWCKANDAQSWGGWAADVDTIDFTGNKATVCVSMYAEAADNLQLKLEGSATGPDLNIILDYTTPGEWQELCFDYSEPDINGNVGLGHLYTRISFFPDFGVVPPADRCYYLDNVYKITNGGGAILELLGTVIETSPDHTILSNLLSTADLWGPVNAAGVTIFAPTDDAFNALPQNVMDALMNNTDNLLYNALLHHVVADTVSAEMMTQDMHMISQNGQDIIVTEAGAKVANANITTPDVAGVNGMLHIVDAVLEFPDDPEFYMIADYESPEFSPEWTDFNGGSNTKFEIVPNPAPDDGNNSSMVGSFVKDTAGNVWQGIYYDVERPLNLYNDMLMVCMDYWSPTGGIVRLKLEKATTGTSDFPAWQFENDVVAGWNEVCWDLSGIDDDLGVQLTNHIFTRLTLFFDFPFENATLPDMPTTFYFDNMRQVRLGSTSVQKIDQLENFRFYPNPATNMINIESDTPLHRVTVFDVTGRYMMQVNNPVENNLEVSRLQQGMYFASFQDEHGNAMGTVRFIKQ